MPERLRPPQRPPGGRCPPGRRRTMQVRENPRPSAIVDFSPKPGMHREVDTGNGPGASALSGSGEPSPGRPVRKPPERSPRVLGAFVCALLGRTKRRHRRDRSGAPLGASTGRPVWLPIGRRCVKRKQTPATLRAALNARGHCGLRLSHPVNYSSGVARLMLGSVSSDVIGRAHCP